jgi:hypothetical protein
MHVQGVFIVLLLIHMLAYISVHHRLSVIAGERNSMGVTPRSVPPSDSNYVTKEMNNSTYHYMPLVQERHINRPMRGYVGADTREKSTMASYMPPHIRLRLRRRPQPPVCLCRRACSQATGRPHA